jgi:hypothetical protein
MNRHSWHEGTLGQVIKERLEGSHQKQLSRNKFPFLTTAFVDPCGANYQCCVAVRELVMWATVCFPTLVFDRGSCTTAWYALGCMKGALEAFGCVGYGRLVYSCTVTLDHAPQLGMRDGGMWGTVTFPTVLL